MDNQIIEAAELAGSVNADDFSMITLFLRADIVVKLVVAMLILTSIKTKSYLFSDNAQRGRDQVKSAPEAQILHPRNRMNAQLLHLVLTSVFFKFVL